MQPHGKRAWRTEELQRLVQRVRQVENGGWDGGEEADRIHRGLKTSWPGIDQALGLNIGGGLSRGAVHEWFGVDTLHESESHAKTSQRCWSPPMALLIHLAWCALEGPAELERGLALWIGRAIWPHPRALVRNQRCEFTAGNTEIAEPENLRFQISDLRSQISDLRSQISNQRFQPNSSTALTANSAVQSSAVHLDRRLLDRSTFIDPPDDAARLWAMDVALRSPAVAAVIADGRRITMAESRRLQLAAEAGGRGSGGSRGGSLALLARTSRELDELSAAATRWRVRRAPSTTSAPRWIVELLRCKANPLSVVNAEAGAQRWIMELDRATGRIACLADVVDRSSSTALAQDRAAMGLEPGRSVRQSA